MENKQKEQLVTRNILQFKYYLIKVLGNVPNDDSIFYYAAKFAFLIRKFRKSIMINIGSDKKINKDIMSDLFALICHVVTVENDINSKKSKIVKTVNNNNIKIFTNLDTNPEVSINETNNSIKNININKTRLSNKLTDKDFSDNDLYTYKDSINTFNKNYRDYSHLFKKDVITEEEYRTIRFLTYTYILNYRNEILRLINLILNKEKRNINVLNINNIRLK